MCKGARPSFFMEIEVLYKDQHIIVFNKPAGLLSVPGRGEHKQDSASSRIQKFFPGAEIVHRLDCHTSGVMLMAMDKVMQRELSRSFHDRKIEKEYIAVVNGSVKARRGVIEAPMRGEPKQRPCQLIDFVQGKAAVTEWVSIDQGSDKSRLLLKPITGRTHQLRVHCQYMGYPIVGDRLYGSDVDKEQPRMLLHAASIQFKHPYTGELNKFTATCDF